MYLKEWQVVGKEEVEMLIVFSILTHEYHIYFVLIYFISVLWLSVYHTLNSQWSL